MVSIVFGNWIPIKILDDTSSLNRKLITFRRRRRSSRIQFKSHVTTYAFSSQSFSSIKADQETKSRVHYDSLRLLEWDKVCESVASFAGTSLGREATKEQLWKLNQSYEDSLKLLEETNAAVQMNTHGACRLDFSSIDLHLVKSAIRNARRGSAVTAGEARSVGGMLEVVDALQVNLKYTSKKYPDVYKRFMPLSQPIMELVVSRPLIKGIKQVVDDDGSVKDTASPALKRSREQVRLLESKLFQLMETLIRSETRETHFAEVSSVSGRWCIKSGADQLTNVKGLLLNSDSGKGRFMEPLSAVPLNDELQQARGSVAKAETEVLLMLTEKIQKDLDDIEKISDSIIQLDVVGVCPVSPSYNLKVINARANYSFSFGGASPELYLPEDQKNAYTEAHISEKSPKGSYPVEREWKLYMPKAYHPLLLQQHKQNQRKARKETTNTNDEIKRKLEEDNKSSKGEAGADVSSSKLQVSAPEQSQPVPVGFFVSQKTRVLIITGPNTGGKTICLKTIGLAAMMAKSGLYVLSSQSVQIPWFDSVFADIGDEQSLSQSLSTFSGHLKQISDIRSQSTRQSLVLLDEVGAGTNPLEGAALGMSLLESFADSGALLTIATTHHGELKSLKYSYNFSLLQGSRFHVSPFASFDSNDVFENACMEFDEVNLKPTYKILWGVPGRSNAINISERLGLPNEVVSHARELYGVASSEINEVILDMERFKQEFQELLLKSRRHMMLARTLREKILLARRKICEYSASERYKKTRQISQAAAVARSILHNKVRQLRADAAKRSQPNRTDTRQLSGSDSQRIKADNSGQSSASMVSSRVETGKKSVSVRKTKIPEIGETVQVSSLGREAKVLRVDPSKKEVVVQAGNMKLKLKIADILT
ncbi:hypothetical protein Tsubulata_000017 [Turnera subulata]|uniref:DNA mismatch repair proteins mutS family domain-containing protein n=1 Tax=Turnera subulata TaxID=218843 RepID=A0A9Q0FLC8_9ROSI|nr:hypothetical protein Tsubulata_000017 [Turnera subulata]